MNEAAFQDRVSLDSLTRVLNAFAHDMGEGKYGFNPLVLTLSLSFVCKGVSRSG